MFSRVCLLLSGRNKHSFLRFFSCIIGGIEISELLQFSLANNTLFINCPVISCKDFYNSQRKSTALYRLALCKHQFIFPSPATAFSFQDFTQSTHLKSRRVLDLKLPTYLLKIPLPLLAPTPVTPLIQRYIERTTLTNDI